MRKLSRSADDRIPDSALADVAFLLLIFFLATTVIGEEFGLPLALPAKGREPAPVHTTNVMRLTTDPAGETFFVDGRPTALAEIRGMVRERQAGNPQLVVLVDPHRRSPYHAMVDLLDEVKMGGARRISVRTAR